MECNTDDGDNITSQQVLCVRDRTTRKRVSTLKLFIVALSFAYFSKALAGSYMKSSITQIERRFDLSSSHTGVIDSGFEIGNLLFLVVVSHVGAKLHRPRLIAMGCFLMALGAFLTGLPHFFMGRYRYGTVSQVLNNDSVNIAACADPLKQRDLLEIHTEHSPEDNKACVKESGSHMWMYVFLGNALRGVGETPVTPLGISYIDDFAKAKNSPFYIACLQTITLLGPMCGFLLGSYCAKLYVDIGYVDLDSVAISPKDSRWVGAWWMGFLVSSVLLLLSSIPFWFLPHSLLKQGANQDKQSCETLDTPADAPNNINSVKLSDIAKGFLPSLKRLLGTPTYFLLLCGSILKFNSLIGLFTFKAKYMEQQFGQSASRANFLIGVLNLPVVAVGIFLGGLLMKRYKLSVVSGAQLSFATSFMSYLLLLLQFSTKCGNIPVAGLTVSYNGAKNVSYDINTIISECNSDCSCSVDEWDPVCAESGITYVSPCMAGCLNSTGYGKNTLFHNCSCVSAPFPAESSPSVRLGQCSHAKECGRSFKSYMAVSVLSSFINGLGLTPGYMVIIRCISADLKSLALGIHTLAVRTLGGIPAPVYFGALIDSTCLRWSVKHCGSRGVCRIYDSDMYRFVFLGLISCLSGSSYFFMIVVIVLLRKQFRKPELEMETQEPEDSKVIELHTTSFQPVQRPELPHTLSVQVMMATKVEEGMEVQLTQEGNTFHIHQDEKLNPKYLTESTVEFSISQSEVAKIEIDEVKSEERREEEEQREEEEVNKETKEDETLNHHTNGLN
ncbi:solute carrier organic anion transporter family member 1C1-like [Thalassophryne amazonica]|uniref:solute carrier organic anion transporter family member 1C1-like n=1 Tax=Thalassophryne amazonica TaxID=390379 RepID=UPI0014722BF4|nr:solute carrier organic anion transporter family member 1C1-like [Thalassophryne amazonica]